MDAAFRAVHAAALRAVTVVEQLAGQAGQLGAFGCFEAESRHARAVLAEVHHQILSGMEDDRLCCLVLAVDDYLSVSILAGAGDFFPDICLYRG